MYRHRFTRSTHMRIQLCCACRLPVLADLNQAIWLQNQDEHASGQPVVAALRRLPMDGSTATNYVLHAAPTENLPCDTRMHIGVAPCHDAAFWRSKAGVALIAVGGSLLLLVLCCVLARGYTSWRLRNDARFMPTPKHGVSLSPGGSRSTPPDLAKRNAPSAMSDSMTLGKHSSTKGSKWRGSPDTSGKPVRARRAVAAHDTRLAEKCAPCGGDSSPSEASWALTAEPSTVEPTVSHIGHAAAAAALSADQQQDALAGSHSLRIVLPVSPSGSSSALSAFNSSRSLSPVRTLSPRQARSGALPRNQAPSAQHGSAPSAHSAMCGTEVSADFVSHSAAASADAAAHIAKSPYLYLSASDASVRSAVLARNSALRASGAPPLSGEVAVAPAPAHPVWARQWTNVQASLPASAAHSADVEAARDATTVHNPAYDAASAEQLPTTTATRAPAIANLAYSPHAVDSLATLRRTSPKTPFAAGRPTLPALVESPDKNLKAIAHAILSRGHWAAPPGELLRASSVPEPLPPTHRAAVAASPARTEQHSVGRAAPVLQPASSPSAQGAQSPQRVRTTARSTPHGSPMLPVLQPQMCFAGAMPRPWGVDANVAMHAQRQQLMAKTSGFGTSVMQQMHCPVITARGQGGVGGAPHRCTMTRRDGQRCQNAVRQHQQHARGQVPSHDQSLPSQARAGQQSPVQTGQRGGSAQAGASPVRRTSPCRLERPTGDPLDAARHASSAHSHLASLKRAQAQG